MKKRLMTYKKGKNRFECSYENCNRVRSLARQTDFECTMCGHGIMSMVEPTAYCYLCGVPIYGNMKDDRDTHDIECWLCTAKQVETISRRLGEEQPSERYERLSKACLQRAQGVTLRKLVKLEPKYV